MMNHSIPDRRAVTLPEAALLLSFSLLLIAMIAPAIGGAREESRIRTCLDNLRQIGAGTNAYLAEFTGLPFTLPSGYGGSSFSIFTEFVYGGGLPDKTAAQWGALDVGISGNTAVNMDVYVIAAARRPLNRYLADGVHWDRPLSQRVGRPMQLPSMFRCPSDGLMLVPNTSNAVSRGERMWEWWGSSYPINWYWPYYYSRIAGSGSFMSLFQYGPRFLNDAGGRHSSELVLFLEGPFNYASGGARPEGYEGPPWGQTPRLNMVGSHGVLDHHSAAFRDGSARYGEFDTRFVYGDGWTLWPRRPWEAPWDAYDGMD